MSWRKGESNSEEENETEVKDCRDEITGLLEEQKKVIIKEVLVSSNEDKD